MKTSKRKKTCKQCANPSLKGMHTCKKLRPKNKKPSLLARLREPIAEKTMGDAVYIYEKLDAIGEAMALLMQDRRDIQRAEITEAYARGRNSGYQEHETLMHGGGQ